MQNMRYQIAVIFAALLILASCAQMAPNGSDISTQAVQLTPYRTATATATITPTRPDAPTSTLAPTITPTPRVYTVKANDTLIDIAYLNGLTLDELKAANPDVNPYNLAIGTKLLIPAAKPAQSTLAVPNPTPAPIPVRAINCTPSLTGGLYCFALIENNQEMTWRISPQNSGLRILPREKVISQSAQFPLSRLKAGTALPFYTYFSPPIAMNPNVELNILTAAAVENGKRGSKCS
jgi:LysM repeat protein